MTPLSSGAHSGPINCGAGESRNAQVIHPCLSRWKVIHAADGGDNELNDSTTGTTIGYWNRAGSPLILYRIGLPSLVHHFTINHDTKPRRPTKWCRQA